MSRLATRFIFGAVIATAGLLLGGPARAVQLDPGGLGQVLIYPYYTANGQQQTLLSITNTSDAAQVLQVTFREALNGRSALQFKLWLAQKDTWSGTVFALADDGISSDGAGVLTRDPSCTFPRIPNGSITSGGAPFYPLGNQNYSGAMSDGGPSDLGRARHGWVEVIALGNLSETLSGAIAFNPNGVLFGCGFLEYLVLGPGDTRRPSGGLAGTGSVIRVAAGTILSTRAEALSGFTGISLYTNDGLEPAPTLASVNEGTLGGAVSAAILDDQGHSQLLTYGTPGSGSRPIDAVSAALMATRLKNEYQTSAALAAATDWVVTLPTKPFYTDPALLGASTAAMPPFDELFLAPGTSRQCVPYRIFDYNQKTLVQSSTFCSLGPPGLFDPAPPVVALTQAANVVPFLNLNFPPATSGVVAAPSPPPGSAGVSQLSWFARPIVGPAGWLEMNFVPTSFNHRLPASAEGKVLSGLPAIGFSASNIVNNNVSNGVLANYASAVRHVTTVACTKASDGSPCD